jgi:hypothetical protein
MAAKAWPAIKALLNTVADAGDAVHQVLFGTESANRVFYPDRDNFEGAKPYVRGRAITADSTLEYLMNKGLATFLDKFSICWATAETNGTGVAPTLTDGYGISGVTKDEGDDTAEFTFDTAYANTAFITFGYLDEVESVHHVHSSSTTTVEIAFHNVNNGLDININSKTVHVLVVGSR